jgi:radical SAM protein with 4Fe4S-binding SPASM domain
VTKSDYYRRLFQVFLSYKKKKTVLPYLPLRLWIEATSYCNLKCVMCPNKDLKKEEKGYMDFGLFKKIIDEASQFVYEIHLLHRGESLLHPDFFKMVKYAHDAKIVTKFHTNGTLLDEKKSHQLIESGLDQFSFSFDGYDQASYERIRVNASFEKTVGNIVRFLEIKKRLHAQKPVTILELINMPDVYPAQDREKKKEFFNYFKGLPLQLEVKELHNWAGDIQAGQKGKKYSACTFPWSALIIFWDGQVLPCTQDFHGYLTLGDVKGSSLAEIWNNQKMVRLREKLIQGNISDLETCAPCDRPWRKQIAGIPTEYLWKFLFKKMP